MVNLDDLPFVHSDMEIDMLGDAYEFLIGRFAATAGKKAGEFYTPQQVSKILAKIVTDGKDKLRHVYDPTLVQVHYCYALVKRQKCIVILDKNVTIPHTT